MYFLEDFTMNEISVLATIENLPVVLSFIDENLEAADCGMKAQMQLDIAVEELYVNIAHYAYTPETGEATIHFELKEDPKRAEITFIDTGMPYDPVAKPDPDVTLSAADRSIGGLGIYLAKKNTDSMTYKREDGRNILTISKNI